MSVRTDLAITFFQSFSLKLHVPYLDMRSTTKDAILYGASVLDGDVVQNDTVGEFDMAAYQAMSAHNTAFQRAFFSNSTPQSEHTSRTHHCFCGNSRTLMPEVAFRIDFLR